ncbi:MAG: CotH kinase family protein [Clostridia bacterium]|nr:CotH kinase family protein [Clostridia bacterium]
MKKILKISIFIFLSAVFVVGALIFVRWQSYKTINDTGLPRLDVYTEERAEIKSKEEYVNCTVSLSGTEAEFSFENLEAGIRGRGNSTWTACPKKPYRIKFNEKTSIFGEKANKSWVLLALYNDFSLTKDRLAFTIADAVGTDVFVPSYNYVELYINGEYNGIYLMTDQVDENKGRSAVKEDFAAQDVEVPFLVELDAYSREEGEEDVAWFSVENHDFTVKYPEEDERYSNEQFLYIKNYISEFDTLTRKPGVTMAELSEYVDMNTFIDFFIVQEVMGQMEVNNKSIYMYKAMGEKMKMGPVWDFDWSAQGTDAFFRQRNLYKGNYAGLRSTDNWFAYLYNGSPEFRVALAARYSEVRADILLAIDKVEASKSVIARAAEKDWLMWHPYRIYKGYDKRFDELVFWCRNRVLWLDTAFAY